MRRVNSLGLLAVLGGATFASGTSLMAQAASDGSPQAVIDRQVEAYNRHDLDGFFATYDDNQTLYTLGSARATRGTATMRQAFTPMWNANPKLHSETFKRLIFGSLVVDREGLSGIATLPTIIILSIYEVRDGHILNYWQSPLAPPKPGVAPIADPDPSAAAVVAQSLAAFNKGDAAGMLATFGDTVTQYQLTSDTTAHVVTRDQLRGEVTAMMQATAHPHAVVRDQVLVGPYVANHEIVTGLPGGKSTDRLVVSLVRDGHIVARWERV